MSLCVRMIWRDLCARPGRSLLTTIAITIGVCGVVAISLAGRLCIQAQRRAYQHHSQADLVAWVWDADESLIRALEQLPAVTAAERRAVAFTKWRFDGPWMDIELQGVEDFEEVRVNQMAWLEGRPPERGEIALEGSVRQLAPVALGDTIEIRGAEGHITRLKVSGFTRTPYYPSASLMRLAVGYLPASSLRPYLGTRGDNRLLIRLRDPRGSREGEAVAQIQSLLDRRRIPHGELEVRRPEAFTGHRELQTLLRLMAALSALGLLIGAFLVGNTFAALVAEHVREIGILKALGATRGTLVRLYLTGGLIFALAGTGAGIGTGWLAGGTLLRYLGQLLNVEVGPAVPDATTLVLGCLVGLGVSLPGSLLPIWHASRISVREALGGYGIRPETGRRHVGLPFPIWWSLAIRELRRRPLRTSVRVAVVAVAVAGFLSARITEVSLACAIDGLFRIYAADAWVWFDRPVGAAFAAQLRAVEGVSQAEGWEVRTAVVGGETVRLWGLPPETALYGYQLVVGRWFRPGEPDAAVLSLDLAQRQGIRVGDALEVETAGRMRSVGVVGIVRDEAIFGLGDAPTGKLFLPLRTVQQMAGLGDRAGVFAVQVAKDDAQTVESVLAAIERKFRSLGPGSEPARTGVEQAREATRIVSGLLYATVALVALTGAIGITTILWLTVWERSREIGILRTLGAGRGHLVRTLAIEGTVCSLLATAVGAPGGILGARALGGIIGATLIHLPLVVRLTDLLAASLFAWLLSVLAGILPALAVTRWPVSEVLRYE